MTSISNIICICIVLVVGAPILCFMGYAIYGVICDFMRSPEEDYNQGVTVLESPSMIAKYQAVKEKANEGCDRCPYCGKKKYVEPDILGSYSWTESSGGLIRDVEYHMHKDRYKCTSCGTRWESAPYYTSRRVFNNMTFKYEDEK